MKRNKRMREVAKGCDKTYDFLGLVHRLAS